MSQSIAAGNLKVFAELAPIFVRFVETMKTGPPPTPAQLAVFVETLDPAPTAQGGQDLLRKAFTAYFQAILEQDAS